MGTLWTPGGLGGRGPPSETGWAIFGSLQRQVPNSFDPKFTPKTFLHTFRCALIPPLCQLHFSKKTTWYFPLINTHPEHGLGQGVVDQPTPPPRSHDQCHFFPSSTQGWAPPTLQRSNVPTLTSPPFDVGPSPPPPLCGCVAGAMPWGHPRPLSLLLLHPVCFARCCCIVCWQVISPFRDFWTHPGFTNKHLWLKKV